MKNTTLLPLLTCDVISISYILKFFDENENNLINYTLDVNGDNILNINFNSKACTTSTIGVGYVIPDVCDVEFFLRSKTKYETIRNSIGFEVYAEINGVTYELQRFYYDNVVRDENNVVFISAYDALSKARQKADFVEDVSSRTLKWRVNNELIPDIVNDYGMAYFNGGFEIVGDYAIGLANYETKIVPYYNKQNDKQYMSSLAKSMASNVIASLSGGQVTAKFVSFDKPDDLSTITEITLENPSQWLRAKKLFKFKRVKFRNRKKIDGKRYSFFQTGNTGTKLTYKWGMSPFLDAKCMTNENLTYARQLIANALSQEFVCFSITGLPALPIFEPGDWIKVYDSDTEDYAYLCVTEISISNDIMTLSCGDVNTGTIYSGGNSDTSNTVVRASASAVSASVDNQFDEIQEQVDETDLSDVDVVKDLDSYLYHINVLKNPEEAGTVLNKISAKHIHADNILDLSSPQTTEYVYSFDFPAVIRTSAQWDGSSVGGYRFNPHMTDIAIPCKVHCELTTDAKLVGMVDSCTNYFCPEIVTNGAGLTSYTHASNHVHGVQLAVDFKLYDENKHVYTLGNCSNVSVTFDETSQIRCSGYGGADMGTCASITDGDHTVPTGATNYSLEDMGISIYDYAKHRLDWSKSTVAYCLHNYKQFGDIEEITPTETLYKSKNVPDSIPSGNTPDYLTLCDANTQYLSNYTLTESDIDENNNWVIPANHCEYQGTTYHRTDDGQVFVPAYIHIIQPTLTVDLDYAANNYNKIKIDLGWIPKDEGWFDRHWDTTYPRWDNYIAKWSIAPYADGYHGDIYNNSKNGHFENEAVQGVISGKLMRLRKETRIPFYLFQYNYAGIKLYDNNDLFEADYNAASAMLNGDTTYYTNALAVTDGTFLVGEYNTSVETHNMLLQAIIGSGNTISNAKANADVVIIGESNYVNNQGLSGVLIGSGNAVNLNGLAVMENNYGFAFIPETDDIYMFLGREEMYSIRELINRIYSGGVTFEISEDGTVITITNEGTGDYVNILQKTYSLSFDVSGSDALVITLTSDTGDSSSISIPYDNITTGVFNTMYGRGVITRISNLERRMTTAEGDIDTLENRIQGIHVRVTTAEGEIDTLQTDVSSLGTRVTTAEGDIDTLETNVSGLTTRVDTAEGEIDTLQTDLGALTTRVGTAEGEIDTLQSDVSGLGTRMTMAEGEIDTLQSDTSNLGTRMTTAEGEIDTLQTDLGALTTRVGTAEGDIDSLESSVSGLSTRMTTAEGDIDTLEGNVSSLSTRMTSAEGDIDTLESSVSGLSTRMTTAEGDIDTLESGLSGLTTRVTTAEGEIDTLQSDLTNLTTRVGTAEGDIDTLESDKMDKANPTGTGALSLNRLADSTVGTNSVAIGTNTTASGTNSLAGGRQAVASGDNSLAYGNTATASGGSAVAIGFRATASISSAVAIGGSTTASGAQAIALGRKSTASGKRSVALSGGTATGDDSLAFGEDTEAYFDNSVALGRGLITTNRYQVVVGKYNATNNYASFVIGDGENSDARYNVMWVEGNCMYIQATRGNNPLSVVNVKYLQDNYKLADISTLEAELVEIYNSTAAYTNAAD